MKPKKAAGDATLKMITFMDMEPNVAWINWMISLSQFDFTLLFHCLNYLFFYLFILFYKFIFLFIFSVCWKKKWQYGVESVKNGGFEEIEENVRCGYCIWRRTVRSLWLVRVGNDPRVGFWLVRYLLGLIYILICTAERLQRNSLVSCVGWTGFWHIGHVARNWSELEMQVEQNTWPHGDAIIYK